jgi:5-methylcytosine-specific restriction endonuclease McrA
MAHTNMQISMSVATVWAVGRLKVISRLREKKVKEFNLQQFVIWTLRKASYRTKARSQALAAARVPVPSGYPNKRIKWLHTCAECKAAFPQKEVQVDHKIPVVDPITGFTTFDEYIKRMFCGPENLQILCRPCHKEKTNSENKERRSH